MHKVNRIKNSAQLNYLDDQHKESLEYFNSTNENDFFHGKGAQQLGLTKTSLSFDEFRSLAEGRNPKSGQWMYDTFDSESKIAKNRSVGQEFVFEPDKSISVAFAIGDDLQRSLILDAHKQAVKKALDYIEKDVVKGRMGKDGLMQVKADCIFGVFQHIETRDSDPQIHSHVVLLNLAKRQDGKWSAVEALKLTKAKETINLVYQSALADELGKNFDLAMRTDTSNPVVAMEKVDGELIDLFSKRSKAIDAWLDDPVNQAHLKEKNIAHEERQREYAWKATRKAKLAIEQSELDKSWEQQYKEYVARKISQGQVPTSKNLIGNLAKWSSQSEEKRSEYAYSDMHRRIMAKKGTKAEKYDLYASVLRANFLQRSLNESNSDLESWINDAKRYAFNEKTNQVITNDLINMEQRIQLDIEQTRTKKISVISENVLKHRINEANVKSKSWVGDDAKKAEALKGQLEAVRKIGQSKGMYATLLGEAGTGKTTALSTLVQAYKDENKKIKVYGTSTSEKATKGLLSGVNEQAPPGKGIDKVMNLTEFNIALKKKKIQLNSGDVVIVDEAGMMSTKDLYGIHIHAKKAGAKVILVGDPQQLGSIGAGGVFTDIQTALDTAQLNTVLRQKLEADIQAAKNLRHNTVEGVSVFLKHYSDSGLLQLLDSDKEMMNAVAKDYINSPRSVQEKFCIASTNAQACEIANFIQAELAKLHGKESHSIKVTLKNESKEDKEPAMKIYQNFSAGDVIRITANSKDKRLSVSNNDFFTIKSIKQKEKGFLIHAVDEKGKEIVFNTDRFKNFTLGYAGTVHKSQGATYDEVFSVLGGDAELAYVSATRHKSRLNIYATESRLTNFMRNAVESNTMKSALSFIHEENKSVEAVNKSEASQRRDLEIKEIKAQNRKVEEEIEKKRKIPNFSVKLIPRFFSKSEEESKLLKVPQPIVMKSNEIEVVKKRINFMESLKICFKKYLVDNHVRSKLRRLRDVHSQVRSEIQKEQVVLSSSQKNEVGSLRNPILKKLTAGETIGIRKVPFVNKNWVLLQEQDGKHYLYENKGVFSAIFKTSGKTVAESLYAQKDKDINLKLHVDNLSENVSGITIEKKFYRSNSLNEVVVHVGERKYASVKQTDFDNEIKKSALSYSSKQPLLSQKQFLGIAR